MTTPSKAQKNQIRDDGLNALAQGTARDLRSLQIKLTYIGSQAKPLPSVIFTTFYHFIQMDWFLPLRQPYLHYDNDDIAIWNFTVAPDEIKRVVTQLVELQKQWTFPEINFPYLSVMLVLRNSRLGQASWEAILNRDDAEVLTRAIREVLDAKNGLGRDIIDLQRQLIFT